ncbi:hypothetical protein C8J56DRAFT_770086 [Mycena floridula]|nr:hypothetical protein C8J56DRAFT_770086 [Mycena floridula]
MSLSRTNIGTRFTTVTELALKGVEFASLSQLMALVLDFPVLQRLFLCNSAWDEGLISPAPTLAFPHIQHLHIREVYKSDIINWLLAQTPIPVIPHLDLDLIHPPDVLALGSYLRVLGPSLMSLRLGFCSLDAGGDAEDFYEACDLSVNTQLRAISFGKFIWQPEYQLSSPVPWIFQILDSLKSMSLVRVEFSVYVTGEEDEDDIFPEIQWEVLDEILTQDSFKLVQMVRFAVTGLVEISMVEKCMARYLPTCHGRGLLHCRMSMGEEEEVSILVSTFH